MNSYLEPTRNIDNEFIFKTEDKDKQELFKLFKPNLSPSEIFEYGSFGGVYWKKIKSNVTNTILEESDYKKYPDNWWTTIQNKNI